MGRVRDIVHRQLWRRIPRSLRRSAITGAVNLLYPAAHAAAAGAPVTVVGELSSASGLGESARLCHGALQAAGVTVNGIDIARRLLADQNFSNFAFTSPGPRERGSMVVHVNPFPLPIAVPSIGRARLRAKRVVGYFAWELERPPEIWRKGVRYVDEIWVPSHFSADALAPIAGGRVLRVMAHPVALNDRFGSKSCQNRAASRPFTVLTIFNMRSSFARKNPLATIEAFRAAFGASRDHRLIIKVLNGSSFPEGWRQLQKASVAPNINILDGHVSAHAMNALYLGSDIVASLHRSEGFGLLAAEAMLAGRAVVATDFSGTRDFLNAENGVPIPFRLVPARDPQGEYDMPACMWAEPEIDAAIDAFRRLAEDESFCRRLGERARSDALTHFDPVRYARAAASALDL